MIDGSNFWPVISEIMRNRNWNFQNASKYLVVWLITLNGPWYDFVSVKFWKLLKAPADRISEIMKRDQKIRTKLSADFPFFQFLFLAILSHWYQYWVKVTQRELKVGTYWNAMRHEACKVLAQSPEPVWSQSGHQPGSLKIKMEASIVLFWTRYESFVGLE